MAMLSRERIQALVGDWTDLMIPFMASEKMDTILAILKEEKTKGHNILPEQKNIFRAFKETQLKDVRVIIMGIDPYPDPAYATGVAFSVPAGIKLPVTLEHVFRAIEKNYYAGLDLKSADTRTGDLTYLTKQGIMLMNVALTVEERQSRTHIEVWKPFIQYFVSALQATKRSLIWCSWGDDPRQVITTEVNTFQNNHFVLHEEHPVAAARAKRQWESDHFSRINAIITANQLGELIQW
jgi:uracil-DNA glycosylase